MKYLKRKRITFIYITYAIYIKFIETLWLEFSEKEKIYISYEIKKYWVFFFFGKMCKMCNMEGENFRESYLHLKDYKEREN